VTGNLGSGAMGEVFAGVDELLGREVAVKTLRGRTSGLAARLADERFRLEARAIAQLTHPSVVQVYDLDLAADPPYLVMERVAGPSLREVLARGPLAEPDVRALGIQIANALAAAHARGVVHRDVKPANILAAGPGVWKLADFGVAHVPDSSLTMTGQFIGTVAYAPPEALVRGQLGPEGDVFSLGATLYQAAAGTWPRSDAETRGLLAPVPPLHSVAPGVAPDLAAAIDRACATEPAARPSAAELALTIAGAGSVPGLVLPVAAAAPSLAPAAPNVAPAIAAVALPASTVFVADSTASGSIPGGSIAGGSIPGGPIPGGSIAGGPMLARPAARYRWKHIAAGIATLLVILLIALSRSSPSAPPGAVTSPGRIGDPGASERDDRERDDREAREHDDREGDGSPKLIQAKTPPITTEEAAHDWQKVVDKLYEHRFGEARRRLAEFETKHGETDETRELAKQLDSLPEQYLRERGRGKKGRGD